MIADQLHLPAIESLASTVATQFGKIDMLLINAGISKFAPIALMTEDVFDEIMNINFKSNGAAPLNRIKCMIISIFALIRSLLSNTKK